MADNRRVKKNIRQLQRVKTWQLIILLVIGLVVSATFLRLNNVGMVERRTAVYRSDERGADQDLRNNLFSLQRHTAAHMNASTGVMYLQDSYDRDVKKSIAKAQAANNGNNVLVKADRACQRQYTGNWTAYVQCVANEQAKYQGSDEVVTADLPNPALYRQEFVSPWWTPDFAGWSLLVNALILLVIIGRAISLGILKLLLRRHYASV